MHQARQQLLLHQLSKYFDVDVKDYRSPYADILGTTANMADYFQGVLTNNHYDLVLIRGDRFEVLPIAMMASYRGFRVAHLEGGDVSGAIDNKVRKAITALADIHFATNKESYARLIAMGTDPDWTFNLGSLDVEYANSIVKKEKPSKQYVMLCHHAMEGEDPALIEKIIREEFKGKLIVIKSNSDNGTPYGTEEYEPKEYLNLLANASCLVGNSSSFIKEASIFGVPVVNVGSRQVHRLKSHNVKDVPFQEYQIRQTFKMQLQAKYEPSYLYYQAGTSSKIAEKINEFLSIG